MPDPTDPVIDPPTDPVNPPDPGPTPTPVDPTPVDPTPTPTPPPTPVAGRTIGDSEKAKDEGRAASEASTAAAVEADRKAASDLATAKQLDSTFAADLKAIGKPLVTGSPEAGYTITYSTADKDGMLGYSTDHGVGPGTAIPAGPDTPPTGV